MALVGSEVGVAVPAVSTSLLQAKPPNRVNTLRTTATVRVNFGTLLPGFTRLFLPKIITVPADKRYWLMGQFVARYYWPLLQSGLHHRRLPATGSTSGPRRRGTDIRQAGRARHTDAGRPGAVSVRLASQEPLTALA